MLIFSQISWQTSHFLLQRIDWKQPRLFEGTSEKGKIFLEKIKKKHPNFLKNLAKIITTLFRGGIVKESDVFEYEKVSIHQVS